MSRENKGNNKIKELMGEAMTDLEKMVNVNTVIGQPVTATDGTTIIPICKVTMGFMTGGGEYGEIKQLKTDRDAPFVGGNGAVVSMKPMGVIACNDIGVKLICTEKDAYEKLFDTVDNLVEKLKK